MYIIHDISTLMHILILVIIFLLFMSKYTSLISRNYIYIHPMLSTDILMVAINKGPDSVLAYGL